MGSSFMMLQKNIIEYKNINKLLNNVNNKTTNQTVISINTIIRQANIRMLFTNQLVESFLYFIAYIGAGMFLIYILTGILTNR